MAYLLRTKQYEKDLDEKKQKCHTSAEDARVYKAELDLIADSMQDKDRQIEVFEKVNADILQSQQRKMSGISIAV